MKNNAPVGGAIALDVCIVLAFARGPPPSGKPMTHVKRIKKYADSNKNVLVWTASKS